MDCWLAGWLLRWLASWLGHCVAGLAGFARFAGSGVWFPGFVGMEDWSNGVLTRSTLRRGLLLLVFTDSAKPFFGFMIFLSFAQ